MIQVNLMEESGLEFSLGAVKTCWIDLIYTVEKIIVQGGDG